MKTPLYTPAARQDLIDILNYISRDKPDAALAWVERIESACLLISKNPAMGELYPHLGEGVRATTVGRYIVFHRESNEQAVILRVLTGDRENDGL